MALICPKCKTRNRTVAKFCIECITSLPTGCSDTDFAPSPLAAQKASYLKLFRALDALARSTQPTLSATTEKAARETVPASKGLWISVASLITLLAIGSAGWLVAGAGGWYLYTAGSAQVDPPRPDSVASDVAAAKSAPEIQEAPAPASPSSRNVQPQIDPVPEPPHPVDAQSEVDGPVRAPDAAVVRSRVPVPVSPHASQSEVIEAPKPRAVAPADPMAACSGLNFIAEAQCMAAQCLKPALKSHAQCEAVHRRQQLEEEKRNPVAP